jgi:hypothetical protein
MYITYILVGLKVPSVKILISSEESQLKSLDIQRSVSELFSKTVNHHEAKSLLIQIFLFLHFLCLLKHMNQHKTYILCVSFNIC